jgi:hypothetical protein
MVRHTGATALGANPQAIAVATGAGCSAVLSLPLHTPDLIMMTGNHRFGDFFKVGGGPCLTFLALLRACVVLGFQGIVQTLIRGGTVITASETRAADARFDGKIARIDRSGIGRAQYRRDGKLVMPVAWIHIRL